MTKTKSIPIWIGINKNGFISTHCCQPIRDEERGKWISKKPFCNSQLQTQVEEMIAMANLSWANDPEFIEIQIKTFSFENNS